ncbi:MAG: hypothetical protein EU549_01665 [Promethearchaeota archaeon]|nr:MAG: hypothetical protein EU549_01665 [Candidatus Lokiarchaeota archaeon]
MANVKLKNKKLLEQLQAKLVLIKGRKISQQEILDKCIEFSDSHLDDFINEKIMPSELTEEKIKSILSNAIDCPVYYQEKTDDEVIYDL